MQAAAKKLADAIQYDRLLDTAIKLVEVPSPTRSAADVSDRLLGLKIGADEETVTLAITNPLDVWNAS